MSATVTMTAAQALVNAQKKAARLSTITSINKDANAQLSQVIRQMLAQRNAKPRTRSFRDKFFDIRKRRGVPSINLAALAACPPGNRHQPPVILIQGPSPTIESLPPKAMERRLATYKDMNTITKYDSEQDAEIKYYIQLRDYYSALQIEQPSFIPSYYWLPPVARKPAPSVEPVPVQGWVNMAPCPAPAKRGRDESSDGYSRQPAKRTRHSISISAAPCNQ
ncbi:unnamed protein product [Peniophora sp. CBMAI 1063]|nr:unnamed protein product [Peniophora sp. CBMAI 1063]